MSVFFYQFIDFRSNRFFALLVCFGEQLGALYFELFNLCIEVVKGDVRHVVFL